MNNNLLQKVRYTFETGPMLKFKCELRQLFEKYLQGFTDEGCSSNSSDTKQQLFTSAPCQEEAIP
jgi:hypothetical protein